MASLCRKVIVMHHAKRCKGSLRLSRMTLYPFVSVARRDSMYPRSALTSHSLYPFSVLVCI